MDWTSGEGFLIDTFALEAILKTQLLGDKKEVSGHRSSTCRFVVSK